MRQSILVETGTLDLRNGQISCFAQWGACMTSSNRPGIIEIRVNEVSQLFDTLDPFPFPERDLDRDAEEFIVGWARELPRDKPLKIVIHLPVAEFERSDQNSIKSSLNRYFDYRAGVIGRDINELFRVGRVSLLIGISILAAGLLAAQGMPTGNGSTPIQRFTEESIVILSWVANWRPLEIFLYDWWPLLRRRNLYRRLATSAVEFRAF